MSRVCPCWIVRSVAAMAMVASGCSSSSPPISVSLTASSSQAIDQGQTLGVTATVTNDRLFKGALWSLTGPGSLSNSTGLTVTYIPPTIRITSGQQATVTATSAADQTKSASLQITVNPDPQIPFQTLANGSVGAPYTQTIALTGGTSPFQWSVYNGPIDTGYKVGGAVPDGLVLNPSTGTISGTPTGAGTWYFEATVTDAAGLDAINGFFSIQIASIAPAGIPVPFLNQTFVPTAIAPGNPGFLLSVSGAGFVPAATINFNRKPLTTTFVDSEHLTAMVSAAIVANPQTATVTVMNPGPVIAQSNPVYFQVAAANTTMNFAPAANSPLQIYGPSGIAAGDFNEDGKQDLAISTATRASIFLGKGDGTFALAQGSPVPVPSPPYDDAASPYTGAIAIGDFNHSGHLGLAIAESQNAAAVILLGNGDATFSPSSAAFANSLGFPVSDLKAADFNLDGSIDLAITNQILGQSPVALGYGKGAFSTAGDLYTGSFPVGVTVGDFNADGKLDAVVASGGTTRYPSSGVSVSLGNGDGTFTQPAGSPIPLGENLSAIVASDFNGDGKLDLAVTDSAGNAVIILLGNGDGTFGAPTTLPVGTQPEAIIAADLNNDGKIDLAITNFADNAVTILLGNGDGTFAPASGSPYAVGRGPYQLVVADFNGDGKLDLAVGNITDGTVSILLQQ